MSDYIGSAQIVNGLCIISDVPMISGYARQTLSGGIVIVNVTNWATKDYETHSIEVSFEWESSFVLRQINRAWGRGTPVWFRADWLHGKCVFDPSKGLYNLQHVFGAGIRRADMQYTDSDYWSGNIKLLVLDGTVNY